MKKYVYGMFAIGICFAIAIGYEQRYHLDPSFTPVRSAWPSTNFVPLVVLIDPVKVYWIFGEKYRMSINGAVEKQPLSSRNLTNRLASLHLQFGDVVVSRKYFDGPVRQWLLTAESSNNVALSTFKGKGNVPFFTAPVYNWVAPITTPDMLDDARFFINGQFLGNAENGFRAMLSDLEKRKPKAVIIVGSFYRSGGFGFLNSPFVEKELLVESILEKNGITQYRPMVLY